MPLHKDLTGADLHEPKGVASASVDTVYVANGSGSGTWQKIASSQINNTSIKNINKEVATFVMENVGDPSIILLPFPEAGSVTKVTVLLHGALSGADGLLTFTKNGGATLGTLTLTHTGSAEGTLFTFTPVSNQDVTAGGYLKIANNGASTGAVNATVFIEFTRT
jgi:hypothetical protein